MAAATTLGIGGFSTLTGKTACSVLGCGKTGTTTQVAAKDGSTCNKAAQCSKAAAAQKVAAKDSTGCASTCSGAAQKVAGDLPCLWKQNNRSIDTAVVTTKAAYESRARAPAK